MTLAGPSPNSRPVGYGGPMMKRLILGVTESLACGLLFLAGHYVRDARLRRRLTAAPVESGSEFEFPARLQLREIVCDDPDVEVATVVCNLPQLNAHMFSVGSLSRRVDDAHSSEE